MLNFFLDDDDDEEESSKITETEAATPSKKAKEPELKEASGKRTKGLPVKGNVGGNILFASRYTSVQNRRVGQNKRVSGKILKKH